MVEEKKQEEVSRNITFYKKSSKNLITQFLDYLKKVIQTSFSLIKKGVNRDLAKDFYILLLILFGLCTVKKIYSYKFLRNINFYTILIGMKLYFTYVLYMIFHKYKNDEEGVIEEGIKSFRFVLFVIGGLMFGEAISKEKLIIWNYVYFLIMVVLYTSLLGLKIELEEENKEKDRKLEKQNSDIKLYPTRKNQAEMLEKYLTESDNLHSFILIDGEWGIGKTTFVKAGLKYVQEKNRKDLQEVKNKLEKESNENNTQLISELNKEKEKLERKVRIDYEKRIININAMLFSTKKEMIKVVFDELESYLEENKICVNGFREVSEYLESIMSEAKGAFGFLKNKKGGYEEKKTIIKKKLGLLNKENQPILVVDNIERIEDKKHIIEILGFLHEVEEIEYIQVIVLADKNKLEDEKYKLDKNYMDKFFIRSIKLREVNVREIIKNEKILKYSVALRERISLRFEYVNKKLNEIKKNNEKDFNCLKYVEEFLRKYEELTSILTKKISNPRFFESVEVQIKIEKAEFQKLYEIRGNEERVELISFILSVVKLMNMEEVDLKKIKNDWFKFSRSVQEKKGEAYFKIDVESIFLYILLGVEYYQDVYFGESELNIAIRGKFESIKYFINDIIEAKDCIEEIHGDKEKIELYNQESLLINLMIYYKVYGYSKNEILFKVYEHIKEKLLGNESNEIYCNEKIDFTPLVLIEESLKLIKGEEKGILDYILTGISFYEYKNKKNYISSKLERDIFVVYKELVLIVLGKEEEKWEIDKFDGINQSNDFGNKLNGIEILELLESHNNREKLCKYKNDRLEIFIKLFKNNYVKKEEKEIEEELEKCYNKLEKVVDEIDCVENYLNQPFIKYSIEEIIKIENKIDKMKELENEKYELLQYIMKFNIKRDFESIDLKSIMKRIKKINSYISSVDLNHSYEFNEMKKEDSRIDVKRKPVVDIYIHFAKEKGMNRDKEFERIFEKINFDEKFGKENKEVKEMNLKNQ